MQRAARGIKGPPIASNDLVVAGRAPGTDGSASSSSSPYSYPYSSSVQGQAAAVRTSQGSMPSSSSSTRAHAGAGSSSSANGDLSLMSLMAYSQQHVHGSVAPHAPSPSNYSAASTRAVSTSAAGRHNARSITPLRYGASSSSIGVSSSAAGGISSSLVSSFGSVNMSHPAPLSAVRGGASSLLAHSPVTRSMPSMLSSPAPYAAGRAPSADRSAARGYSSASLRATLHTDTLSSAERPRNIPERNAQSADISAGNNHGAWKASAFVAGSIYGSAAPSQPGRSPSAVRGVGAAAAGKASGSSALMGVGSQSGAVARVLAPNGQPRKVPAALLTQYGAAGAAQRLADNAASDRGSVKSTAQLRYSLSGK